MNQLQSNEKTQSDPPCIDSTESLEQQLSHINYESTVDESEAEYTLSLNMLHFEE